MAHNVEQVAAVFDTVANGMRLESPSQLCLYSTVPVNVYVEVWDSGHGTLAFRPNAGGTSLGAVLLVASSTPSSIAFLASQTYEGASLPILQLTPTLLGLPDGAVGGFLYVDAAAQVNVYYNCAGTTDGSVGAGAGILAGRAGPSAFSPRFLPPGATLQFGGFLQ